jgi:glycosyltransferase involved in cell wall biosynthesis
MRICYVCHANSHFALPYIDYFAAHGHEVHLISFHPGNLPGAIMHHPAGSTFDPETDKWPYLWNAWKVARTIRAIRPDVVHAHYLTSNGLIAAASGFHPLVVSARGTDVHAALDRVLPRWALTYVLKRADLVNPVSAELEANLIAMGCLPSRILRLSQGIVPEQFLVDRSSRRSGPIRIICTRPLAPVYQPARIVVALASLAESMRDWEYSFAASGPLEEPLRRQVERLGLDASIRFLGGFQQADLPRLLGDADIFVSASLSDGTSPALLEAMASGAFPVVSNIAANREWLPGQGESLLFDPRDTKDLEACLARAITEGPMRLQAVEVNRARVRKTANRANNMEILSRAYERLIVHKS